MTIMSLDEYRNFVNTQRNANPHPWGFHFSDTLVGFFSVCHFFLQVAQINSSDRYSAVCLCSKLFFG